MDLNKLPNEIIFEIMKIVYHSFHKEKILQLNKQFKSYILEESDIGSYILARIDGMPLLID